MSSVSVHSDERGTLTVVDAAGLPFTPGRTYVLHGMPVGARRAGHASRTQRRMLVGISGSSAVTLADGHGPDRVVELGPGQALTLGPGVWHELEIREPHTAVLVFAEGGYDRGDYVSERPAPPGAD